MNKKDQLIIALLWDSLKTVNGHPDRRMTGWGGKTKEGLLLCLANINKHANHVFDIQFTCDRCGEIHHIAGDMLDILSSIRESGWPICPECGDDMDEYIVD